MQVPASPVVQQRHRLLQLFSLLSVTGLLLLLGGAVRADSLVHLYRFDPQRLGISGESPTAALMAGSLPRTWEEGKPELPYDLVTLLVPRGTRVVGVRAQARGERVVAEDLILAPAGLRATSEGHRVAPKPGHWPGKVSAESEGLYPPVRAEAAGGGMLHGYQLATVRVYPVRYEAGSARVWVATELALEIELAGDGRLPLERERFSAAIESSARRQIGRLVDNPMALETYDRRIGSLASEPDGGFQPASAPSLEGSPVDYVIITGQSLEASFQVLADWKTRRGIPAVVRTVSWIVDNYRNGSDVQETIRSFIRDAYLKWGVQYVVLGGDTDVIPARYGYSGFGPETETDIPTDMYFACLDGNWNLDGDELFGEGIPPGSVNVVDDPDLYAEVYVGRLPVSTPATAAALIDKIIEYENPAVTDYQDELLMLGEVLLPVDWEPGQALTLDGGQFSEDIKVSTGPCTNSTKLYENHTQYPGSTELNFMDTMAELNSGYGFVNHVGHGFRYNMSLGDKSMVNNDAFNLTNVDQRFVLYLLNCTATAFDFPCLAESFLKSDGGAVAVLGSSRAAFPLPAYTYNRGFFQALHGEGIVNVGRTFVESRLDYTPNAAVDNSDHYTHFLYNILADPEMVIHTCELGTTAVNLPNDLGLGLTNVAIQVMVAGVPREGARVCLQKGEEEYVFGLTDSNGDVTLEFVAESAGSIDVTVSGANMTTWLGSINVDAGGDAYVHATTITFDDDDIGLSQGNGDGVPDAAEIVELIVGFRNDGTAQANAVMGVLSIDSPWAAVLDSAYSLGNLTAGGTASSSLQLRVALFDNTPDGTVLPFRFESTDGSFTWVDVINRVVHAPFMEVTRLRVDDYAPGGNGDGIIQAGETFDLIPSFKNYGTGTANDLEASILSPDPDLVILDNRVDVLNVMSMQEVVATEGFRITENALQENVILLILIDRHNRVWTQGISLRPPAKPATPVLDATQSSEVVIATWAPNNEPDLAGYHVYRAFSDTASAWTRVTHDRTDRVGYFRDGGLTPSTKYYYRITAVDSSGNESVPSDVAGVNTSPAQLSGWPIIMGAESSCPAAVGDITGNGEKEIVAGNDNLYAWDWRGIELLDDDDDPQTWGVFASEINIITAAIVLADFDREPGYEIFAASWQDSNRTFVVRGDGSIQDGWPQAPNPTSNPSGYWGSPAAMDVDGDGLAEVFAPAKNGNLYAWHGDGSPLGAGAAFKSGLGAWSRCSPTFADVDADPLKEIIYGAPDGKLHIWNADGSALPNFPKTLGSFCVSSTAIGDINNDGVFDVVMITEGGAIHVVDTKTGNELAGWPKALSVSSAAVSPSPALADFDGDGLLEIVIANNALPVSNSAVRIYDAAGNVLNGWPRFTEVHTSESSPIVADVSGDGVPDVVFGNEGGTIYGWDKDGNELLGFPLSTGDFIRSTPTADDVDGDGDIDLVLAGWDRNLWIWDLTAPYAPAAAQWPTFKHDVQRSGLYAHTPTTATDAGDDDEWGEAVLPARPTLSQNVPNPFNPYTTIEYGIPSLSEQSSVDVRLDIFDVAGRRVRQLVRGQQSPGVYKAIWDGRDDRGKRVHTGVFFYRLQIGGESLTRKMMLLR